MSAVMKAGIAIDAWKLQIFERHLRQNGYGFTNCGQLAEGVLLLKVETTGPEALAEVLKGANTEAAMTGAPQ